MGGKRRRKRGRREGREGRKGMAGPIPNPLLRVCTGGFRPYSTVCRKTVAIFGGPKINGIYDNAG